MWLPLERRGSWKYRDLPGKVFSWDQEGYWVENGCYNLGLSLAIAGLLCAAEQRGKANVGTTG
jgi:hypothetical protein